MHIPEIFAENRNEELHKLIHDYPFGALTIQTAEGMDTNHLPLLLKSDQGPYGLLQGHIATTNLLWKNYLPDTETLTIFQGPNAYISPTYYEYSYKKHGKVAPSWNYTVVHAYGPMKLIEDKQWMMQHLSDLTDANEEKLNTDYKFANLDEDYLTKVTRHLIGFEIPITRLLGKKQLSQQRNPADRQSAINVFKNSSKTSDNELSRLIEEAEKNIKV